MSSNHFLRRYMISLHPYIHMQSQYWIARVPSRARPLPAATMLSRNRGWIAIMFVSSFASEIPFG